MAARTAARRVGYHAGPVPADTRQTYERPGVIDFYARERGLQQSEQALLDDYYRAGMRALDLGVGTGRTTPHLFPGAALYVGIDLSDAMLRRAREDFPGPAFVRADACTLPFRDATFDFAFFSFNGIGALPNDQARRRCLAECRRVLRPAGVLLFSQHNARFLFTRPVFAGVGPVRAAWRLVYSALQSARNVLYRLPSRAFRRGVGYVVDPAAHGGLRVFTATPAHARAELEAAGFRLERCLPAPHVDTRSSVCVPWYYYACVRAD
jgi:SAM-dependent methyltransferase